MQNIIELTKEENETKERELAIIQKVVPAVDALRAKYVPEDRPLNKKDFYRICRAEGIKLARHRRYGYYAQNKVMSGVQGVLFRFKGARVIWLRSFFEKELDLAVAFHELGHAMLGHRSSPVLPFVDYEGYLKSSEELEADFFSELCLSHWC